MKKTKAPLLATWILDHLVPGNRNEALSGDLLEEFQSGRCVGWYWRQALAAVATGTYRELHEHLLPMAFALLWTLPAPFWWSYTLRLNGNFARTIWSLPWPYSTILDLAEEPASIFLFVWVGYASYLLLYAISRRSLNVERVIRGLWIGPVVFIALPFAMSRFPQERMFMAHHLFIAERVPYLFSLLVATWGVRLRAAPSRKTIGT